MRDAQQYLRFGGERARPFFDLIARIGAAEPGYVADLGCGPGNLTQVLARRWPDAEVIGVDNSAEMIAATPSAVEEGRPRFMLADVPDWRPARPPDLLGCNPGRPGGPGHDHPLLRWADPVLEWVKGSALWPVLAALDAEQGEAFLTEYGERVRLAYEPRTFGTLFSFRRVFTVLHRHADPSLS